MDGSCTQSLQFLCIQGLLRRRQPSGTSGAQESGQQLLLVSVAQAKTTKYHRGDALLAARRGLQTSVARVAGATSSACSTSQITQPSCAIKAVPCSFCAAWVAYAASIYFNLYSVPLSQISNAYVPVFSPSLADQPPPVLTRIQEENGQTQN